MSTFESEDAWVMPERGGIRVPFAMFNRSREVDRLVEIIRRRAKPDRTTSKAKLPSRS